MKNILKIEIFVALLAVIIAALFLFFEYDYTKQQFYKKKLKDFSVSYSDKLLFNKKITQAFLQDIINNQFVLHIVDEANKNIDKDENRDVLHRLFKQKYQLMKSMGIEQFHFHLKNGESYLRFHKPDAYGDSLLQRKSIKKIMKDHKKAYGFEMGKFLGGYRYIFPLFYEGKYIGSVETAVSLSQILKQMENSIDGKYTFAIKQDAFLVIDDNAHIKNNYHPFLADQNYLMANSNHGNAIAAKNVVKKIAKSIKAQLGKHKPFIDGGNDGFSHFKVFTFLPIFDISDQSVGYVLSIKNDTTLPQAKMLQFIKFLVALLLIVLLVYFYRLNKKNINILEQLQNAISLTTLVSKTDKKGKITYVNDSFEKISGYKKEELMGVNHNIIRHPDMPKEIYKEMWETIKQKKVFRAIVKNRKKDGSAYYVDSTILPILDLNGDIIEYIGVRHDISDIMNPKKQFLDDLESKKQPLAVMAKLKNYFLLTEFYGEEYMQQIEDYIQSNILNFLPEQSTLKKVYRLDHGEFCFLRELDGLGLGEVEMCLKQFQSNIESHEFILNNNKLDIDFHFAYTTDKKNIFENLKIAIDLAQRDKLNMVFANSLSIKRAETSEKNMKTLSILKDAINNQNGSKIVSFFQPVINNKTNEIDKYESLVRMINQDGDIISPFFFIDIAKKTGYYEQLTQTVLKNSFAALDITDKEITINLSTIDIESLVIRNTILDYISNPKYYGRVVFELLEDEIANDFSVVKDFISLSKVIGGVKIAIDDFGSGYSNFERLLDFQPDILKIDGSLIKNIVNDPFSEHVVEAIVLFAKEEKIETVAEFIADGDIFEKVKSMGIDYSQGFHLGKPEPLFS